MVMLFALLLFDGLSVGDGEGLALVDSDGEAVAVADSEADGEAVGEAEGEAASVASQLVSSTRVPSSTFWHTRTYSMPWVLNGVSVGLG